MQGALLWKDDTLVYSIQKYCHVIFKTFFTWVTDMTVECVRDAEEFSLESQ